MRMVYMGAGEIGLPTLQWLLEEPSLEVVGCFTQPDKKIGRKQILTQPDVKVLAEEHGVPVFQPERLRKNEEALETLVELNADVSVVMAYGQLLPTSIIEAPNRATINLHASLLPRHRGASPIQAAIRDGDKTSGITAMHIAKKLDAGDMIHKEEIALAPDETGGSLHDRLAALGPLALKNALPKIDQHEPQDDELATHCGKLIREDGEIDWSLSADQIERLIRAYDPWPGTYTSLAGSGKKLKIFPGGTVLLRDLGLQEGQPLKDGDSLLVGCGAGTCLNLPGNTPVQLEGKKRVEVGDFLRGNPLPDLFV